MKHVEKKGSEGLLPENLSGMIQRILTSHYEMDLIEFKKGTISSDFNCFIPISALANQNMGGMILFGVEKKENIIISGVDEPDRLEDLVRRQAELMVPPINLTFTRAVVEEKIIVSAEVPACGIFEKPCYYGGLGKLKGAFVKEGDINRMMSEFEIYQYEVFQDKKRDELRIVDKTFELDLNSELDLDQELLNRFIQRSKEQNNNFASMTDKDILSSKGVITDNKITLAGLMVFGVYPQRILPNLNVMIYVAQEESVCCKDYVTKIRVKQRIEGNLLHMLDETCEFVRKEGLLLNGDFVKNTERFQLTTSILREAVLNALIHRDYSKYTDCQSVKVFLHKDKIIIDSPGGLFGRNTLDNFYSLDADKRNPAMQCMMDLIMDREKCNHGIIEMFGGLKKLGLQHPVLENEEGRFRIIFSNKSAYCEKFNYNNKGLKSYEEVKEMVLAICTEPKSREELARLLGFDSQYYMVTRYLRPLISEGVLKMTLPQTPKSKNQRYYTD